jgi:hypothetical protein
MQGPNRNIRRSIKRGLARAAYLGIQILQNPVTPRKLQAGLWSEGVGNGRLGQFTYDSGIESVPLRPHLGR